VGLTEQAFFVLTALAERPMHGYGLVQEVEQLSAGRVLLRVGTLYGVLERMVSEGLVAHARDEVVSGRLRRYYQLTEDGVAALTMDAARQRANAKVAARKLRAAPAWGGAPA
jgi:DNA-binding PadR family transcriptional regulator